MPPPDDPPRSKRPRAAQACDRCRTKKYKCDELYPCSHCKKSNLSCVYQGNYRQLENSRSASYVIDLEKKVEELALKLQVAEAKLSPRDHESAPSIPAINATPCSMSMPDKTTPPASTTNARRPEEPEPYTNPNKHANEQDDEAEAEASDPVDDEITELNHHTNGIEFHGSTSSVAFLGHLQKARDPQSETSAQWPSRPRPPEYSIVSTLHNASFSPTATTAASASQSLATVHESNYYFEQAHVFMSGYFENVHFIHPFIDKEDFYVRAHDLWLRRTPTPDPSFIALYLSVLSFGALLRVWDETQLGGLTRFEWSRKLFGEAQLYLNYLHFPNNLDAVQCLYLMAKICQNELNPNLAYMYLGVAVRTCLAAGFNRNVRPTSDPRAEWISRTWWGLFSLEIEMSFSLGRPDTLGLDDYHNRPLPPRNHTQYAIIPWMVDFARITRKVSVQIYHRRLTLEDKLAMALAIENELDCWIRNLPEWIRPGFIKAGEAENESAAVDRGEGGDGIGGAIATEDGINVGIGGMGIGAGRNDLKDPKWARRQRLVLGIRMSSQLTLLRAYKHDELTTASGYYNVKTLLFRPFLRHATSKSKATSRPRSRSKPANGARNRSDTATTASTNITMTMKTDTPTEPEPDTESLLSTTISKCLDAAQNTISVIHDIYRVHTFFRCWWYNTTYVTFATSTLLLPLSHSVSNPPTSSRSKHTSPPLSTDPQTIKSLTRSVEKAIEILEATDESVVTRKCAEIIRYYLREFQVRNGNGNAEHGHSHSHSQYQAQSHTHSLREKHGHGSGNGNGNGIVQGEEMGTGTGTGMATGAGMGTASGAGWFGNGAQLDTTTGHAPPHTDGYANGAGNGYGYPGGSEGGGAGEFDGPEWAYGFGFPDCSFEGIARFFDDLGPLPILEE
ncbi:Zn(II)2Cys6 transcription factor [Aspergillus mulundensis]|uniref:Putative Zn(II)2Cys6 transcription factor n=1 Tax=Aspergillus mulundensis TaxID=1810919 RepID=A0A3D8RK14_9EURO|nr:putative Zn(II)2Cys6 transcription factor [Aspergillus mulundensis]RDW74385.1 putative Zn(II)2Cys6 transcription factor [Aspergillus mulundensis]